MGLSSFSLAGQAFLPIGTYTVSIATAKEIPAYSFGKKDKLKVEFLVEDGPFVGKIHTEWYTLTEKAIYRVGLLARAAGLTKTSGIDSADFIRRRLQISIIHTEYNNRIRAQVDDHYPWPASAEMPEER